MGNKRCVGVIPPYANTSVNLKVATYQAYSVMLLVRMEHWIKVGEEVPNVRRLMTVE
jgi:hypothetical protein